MRIRRGKIIVHPKPRVIVKRPLPKPTFESIPALTEGRHECVHVTAGTKRQVYTCRGHLLCERCWLRQMVAEHYPEMKYEPLIPFQTQEEIEMRKEKRRKAAEKSGFFQRKEGKTLKLGIGQTWDHVFFHNEKKKMTDEEIMKFMQKEFPKDISKQMESVDGVNSRRHTFNAWATPGKIKPFRGVNIPKGFVSHRYDKKGNKMEAHEHMGEKGIAVKATKKIIVVKKKK